MIRFISYSKPLLQDRESQLFHPVQTPAEASKMKTQRVYPNKSKGKIKAQDRGCTREGRRDWHSSKLSETETRNLHDKEFKVILIKFPMEFGKTMHAHNENFNKEIKKKY